MSILKDKVAVVTGAGRGIGREIAIAMAAQGARVVVNDIGAEVDGRGEDGTPADEVVTEIVNAGGEAVADRHSVAEPEGARAIIQTAVDTFGRVDCVVNNAGILRDGIFHKMTEEQWAGVLHTHLFGSFYVSRAAATFFREQNSGALVHMTSTSGLIGSVGQANYAAAKLGVAALSKSIALDMERFNVRSNCIAPFAWSRMLGAIPNTPDQEDRLAKLRTLTPDKIAPLAVYLCADAADHVSGQIFAVRGDEIFLMSQPRPIRSVHRSEGWTPDSIAKHAMPALQDSFYSLDRTADVFGWDPP
ncbi:MAG: SDR family oxidoreductase [Alphaproteobacteria bacterium]